MPDWSAVLKLRTNISVISSFFYFLIVSLNVFRFWNYLVERTIVFDILFRSHCVCSCFTACVPPRFSMDRISPGCTWKYLRGKPQFPLSLLSVGPKLGSNSPGTFLHDNRTNRRQIFFSDWEPVDLRNALTNALFTCRTSTIFVL